MFRRVLPCLRTIPVRPAFATASFQKINVVSFATRSRNAAGVSDFVATEQLHSYKRFFGTKKSADGAPDSEKSNEAKKLAAKKAKEDKKTKFQQLRQAIESGDEDSTNMLLDQEPSFAEKEFKIYEPGCENYKYRYRLVEVLNHAVSFGRVKVAKKVAELSYAIQKDLSSALTYAVRKTQFESCVWLLFQVEPSISQICDAIQSGDVKLAQLLLLHSTLSAWQNATHDHVVTSAIRSGNAEMVKIVCKALREQTRERQGSCFDGRSQTPMFKAIQMGNTEIIKALLEYKPYHKGPVFRNLTALMLAACTGNLEMVQLLVQSGADIGATTRTGMTAIDCARLFDKEEVVKYLESLNCTKVKPASEN